MAEIKGTNIAAPIVPFTDEDIYATHDAKYGKGGWRTVQTIAERNAIPEDRLDQGMFVYVINDPTGHHAYQFFDAPEIQNPQDRWVVAQRWGGIPIYDENSIHQQGLSGEEDYIGIPNLDGDFNGQIVNKTYETTRNGTYMDILFHALRSLQNEVTRLRNAFKFGIESYQGEWTHRSYAYNKEMGNIEDVEPIWAVQEDGLSEIAGFDFSLGTEGGKLFNPADNVSSKYEAKSGLTYNIFQGSATYDTGGTNERMEMRTVSDTRQYIYTTLTSRNQTVVFKVFDGETGQEINNSPEIVLNLNEIPLRVDTSTDEVTKLSFYSAIIILSRKYPTDEEEDGPTIGKNFIWVSISDPVTDNTLAEGYYNPNTKTLSPTLIELDNTEVTGIELGNRDKFSIDSVTFSNTRLYKFKIYSKFVDFSNDLSSSLPNASDDPDADPNSPYVYKAAHIAIRSVKDATTINNILGDLMVNELIWEEDRGRLWIKSKNKGLVTVGSGSTGGGTIDPSDPGQGGNNDNDNMTTEQLITLLESAGLVKQMSTGEFELNDIADITFIHEGSGKSFKFGVTSEGDLKGVEVADPSISITRRYNNLQNKTPNKGDVRGFISQILSQEKVTSDGKLIWSNIGKDYGLAADRLKIGAFYAPLKTDTVHGCSHSYVELENTSDSDFDLNGCYLHLTKPDSTFEQKVYSLPLTGTIKAGSTYLIRGKQYADFDDPSCFLKVTEFDQEWWYDNDGHKELMTLEITISGTETRSIGYGLALTYGNDFSGENINGANIQETTLDYSYPLIKSNSGAGTSPTFNHGASSLTVTETEVATYPWTCHKFFIDGLYYFKAISASGNYWANAGSVVGIYSNTIYKNTFELDPAKQAFQGLTTKDSSRVRWANAANDYMVVDLSQEFIEYPHSNEKFPVANFTPKASSSKKNVGTDKTKLDPEKPNMVTCSFGTDIYKTRCFNWISVGSFDEYVWIKKNDGASQWTRYQSYTPIYDIQVSSITQSGSDHIINFSLLVTGVSNPDLSGFGIITDTANKILLKNASIKYTSGTYSVTGALTDATGIQTGTRLRVHKNTPDAKKYFSANLINNVYSRMYGNFPGIGTPYTAHKVIVDIQAFHAAVKTEFVYVVGRADKNGNPDPLHTSAEQRFTLYPESYKPRIYQITDQQGFHWIEYQVWAAAANKLLAKINADCAASNIIPILINTGDMTQNGTRINEWYDYYTAGKCLFDHLEQMNVVGNNDLCDADPNKLGTGDDIGKSNSYYFHVFYCYEINENIFTPLIQAMSGSAGTKSGLPKYIPSLYYFDSTTHRFVMMNSEITEATCRDWYSVKAEDGKPINIYTGFEIIGADNEDKYYGNSFTPIYKMLYDIFNDAKSNGKKILTACHEMPFTVITHKSLAKAMSSKSRSIGETGSLVGCHMNQISTVESCSAAGKTPRGVYWLGRLLEHFGVKLCIGGHKHTYSLTWPCREYYCYKDNAGQWKSSWTGPMQMTDSLEHDSIELFWPEGFAKNSGEPDFYKSGEGIKCDMSKFPLIKATKTQSTTDNFLPMTSSPNLTGGVTYFMCQATGYKLTSNKELPSTDQAFSQYIPETTGNSKASNQQKYPMFGIIEINDSSYKIRLARVTNIFTSGFKFTQKDYSTSSMALQWFSADPSNPESSWGKWNDSDTDLITVS